MSGTSGGSPFLIGALSAPRSPAMAAGSADTAVFYSYANNTFSGTPGTSSLTGSTPTRSIRNASYTFIDQSNRYHVATVFESGAGTDKANLTSPGSGTFVGTTNVSTLTVGTSTITVEHLFSRTPARKSRRCPAR